MVVTEFWLQQPLLPAPCLAVLPGPGLVTAALQAEGLLSSLCSAALLQNFRNFTSSKLPSKLLTQVWVGCRVLSFWHQWQIEMGSSRHTSLAFSKPGWKNQAWSSPLTSNPPGGEPDQWSLSWTQTAAAKPHLSSGFSCQWQQSSVCVLCSGHVCDEKPFYYLWFS